jgi:hypothetical protein
MTRFLAIPALVMVTLLAACGGGSSGGTINPSPTPVTASFTPAQPSPADLTVSMGTATIVDDLVTIPVNVTGVGGVYGAAFDVSFDPALAAYVGHDPGTLLEQGGQSVNYTVRTPAGSSLVVVGVDRVGAVPGVDVVGTQTLVKLTFRVRDKGTFPLAFENASLLNVNLSPIPNLVSPWPAGSLQGS